MKIHSSGKSAESNRFLPSLSVYSTFPENSGWSSSSEATALRTNGWYWPA